MTSSVPGGKVKSRSIVVVAIALTLLAGACGSRQSRQDVQKSDSGLNGSSGASASSGTSGSNGGSDTGKFGSLASPCGPGDAKGATDKGVTDKDITITTISDPGGPIPGLNQSLFDTMKAFGKWCNDQGGINGRKVNIKFADAKIMDYQQAVTGACTDSFALVGGLGVLDSLGAQTQVDCGLINVPAAAVNPEQTMADLTYEPLPNPTTDYPVGSARWIAKKYPEALTSAAALRTNVSTTIDQSNRLIAGYKQVGFNFNYVQETNLPETNWAPLVLQMKNKGVQYMNLTATWEEAVPLQKEAALQGFKPAVTEFESNYYDVGYPKRGGADAEGTFVRITIWPFEEASQNPATQQFIDILHSAVPDASPALLGVQAWSAALLWAQSVKNLGSNVTRQGVEDQIKQVHEWTGGGLHQQTDPGAHKRGGCVIMMEVHDGGFVRAYPTPDEDKDIYDAGHGYACEPDGIVPIPGDPSKGAHKK